MKTVRQYLASALLAILVLIMLILASAPENATANQPKVRIAPEFTHTTPDAWINSQPLQMSELKGKVILLDVWTFGCWNCYRSFPWLNQLETKFKDQDFTVIGVHSPEFEHEHDRNKVIAKTKEFSLRHPVMMDNDFSYWKALKNQYWPTFYLIDKQGRIRGRFVGETHSGDSNATNIEAAVRHLLAE
ncbi:MAG: redoxin family protein [Thiolinea sp.]